MSVASLCIHTVDVQRNDGVPDLGGNVPQDWRTLYKDAACRVRPMTAKEQDKWAGRPVIATHIVYFPGMTVPVAENDRLKFGARLFKVLGVRNPSEMDRYRIVECEEIR